MGFSFKNLPYFLPGCLQFFTLKKEVFEWQNVSWITRIRKFNITIADIHSGARFPADCTNRADVAAADPRNAPPVMLLMLLMLILFSGQGSLELLEKWPQGGKPMLDLLWRQKGVGRTSR